MLTSVMSVLLQPADSYGEVLKAQAHQNILYFSQRDSKYSDFYAYLPIVIQNTLYSLTSMRQITRFLLPLLPLSIRQFFKGSICQNGSFEPTGNGIIPSNSIKMCLWNINGFASRKQAIGSLIDKYGFDFVCVVETKINQIKYQSNQTEFYRMYDGYEEYWDFNRSESGYSGILVLTRHLPIAPLIKGIPKNPHYSKEGRTLTLQYQDLYLVVVYKPFNRDEQRLEYRIGFDQAFNQYVKELQKDKKVVIAGDFNVTLLENDSTRPGRTPQQKRGFRQLLDMGFTDSHSGHEKSKDGRLDNILTSQGLNCNKSDILRQVTDSDHLPLTANIVLRSWTQVSQRVLKTLYILMVPFFMEYLSRSSQQKQHVLEQNKMLADKLSGIYP